MKRPGMHPVYSKSTNCLSKLMIEIYYERGYMTRITQVSLVALLMMIILVSGCQNDQVLNRMLSSSAPFDATIVPDALIDSLVSEQINMIGERHYIGENVRFYSDLLPELHARNVRMILLEKPLALSFALDRYVNGDLDRFPWKEGEYYFSDQALIDAVRTFNAKLKASGRQEELFSLYSIDIDDQAGMAYLWMIFAMKRFELDPSFSQYISVNKKHIDQGKSTGLKPEWEKDFIWYLSQEIEDQKYRAVYNPETEGFSPGEKLKNWTEFRETYLSQNVQYFAEKLDKEEKLMIIIGEGHAQHKSGFASSDIFPDMPLGGKLDAITRGKVNITILMHYEQENFDAIGMQITTSRNKVITPQGDFLEKLRQQYGEQWVWVNLKAMPPGDYTIKMESTDASDAVSFRGNIQETYDQWIIIPSGHIQ